ncbi:hypothetical protein K435DRAFT_806783 [Dendrothele bispora CBS 962.96]|uniref:Uncharacterized protein n=1 Tax=Dendrothele bispora (strain CBS 962.96) TaxID=1314807 RepID=A0A4S8L6N5_DENBC|nr:hypothetical protein K435DRAFT_806783 [Dendrothele bispora CBS 962.96]
MTETKQVWVQISSVKLNNFEASLAHKLKLPGDQNLGGTMQSVKGIYMVISRCTAHKPPLSNGQKYMGCITGKVTLHLQFDIRRPPGYSYTSLKDNEYPTCSLDRVQNDNMSHNAKMYNIIWNSARNIALPGIYLAEIQEWDVLGSRRKRTIGENWKRIHYVQVNIYDIFWCKFPFLDLTFKTIRPNYFEYAYLRKYTRIGPTAREDMEKSRSNLDIPFLFSWMVRESDSDLVN